MEPGPTSRSAPRRATFMAACASFLLILVKLTIGLLTGTVSVLASAVDSLLDFIISSFNAYAVRSVERPSDDVYNYGRGKLEGVAALFEGLFILGSAAWILRAAAFKFRPPEGGFHLSAPQPIPDRELVWAIAAMAFSFIVTALLVAYLRRRGRESRSLIIEADTLHYQSDLMTNGGILLALVVARFTGWFWLDPAIAAVIAVLMGKMSLPLVGKGFNMLLDRALADNLVVGIRAIALQHSGRVTGVHELKTRRSGDTNIVEFHLVFDEDIRLREAHRIADEIEMKIRALEEALWVINIHLDPVDDSHRDRKLAKSGRE